MSRLRRNLPRRWKIDIETICMDTGAVIHTETQFRLIPEHLATRVAEYVALGGFELVDPISGELYESDYFLYPMFANSLNNEWLLRQEDIVIRTFDRPENAGLVLRCRQVD